MMGSFARTSPLYIFTSPEVTFSHPPRTPEMSFNMGEVVAMGPFFTASTCRTHPKYRY